MSGPELLAFEAAHAGWRLGPKHAAIREQLGISPVRYDQLLNALIDTPAALVHAPALVWRLRRLRDQRRRARSSRTVRHG